MLTSSIIHRYGICGVFDGSAMTDELFSSNINDPCIAADENAFAMRAKYWDTTVAICQDGKCVVQLILFNTKEGWERYVEDGILIFDQKEI